MAVPYRLGNTTFEPGVATTLFAVPGTDTRRSYAASADGGRFLVSRPLEDTTIEPMTVVLNWEASLGR
jgi:hypothetical protein